MTAHIQQLIHKRLSPGIILSSSSQDDEEIIEAAPKDLRRIIAFLQYDPDALMDILLDLFGYSNNGTVVLRYVLRSSRLLYRVIIQVKVDDRFVVESMTSLFTNADWLEREVYEHYDVDFDNHPNLKRLFLPPFAETVAG